MLIGGCILSVCFLYFLYTSLQLKGRLILTNKSDLTIFRSYAEWGYETKDFKKMYGNYMQETEDMSILIFPLNLDKLENKRENILKLLQSDYATMITARKEIIQSKLIYLRDRVKNSSHLSPSQKLSYSDTLEVIAGTVFERNASIKELHLAITKLEDQDSRITKDIETIRKESLYSEITHYLQSCQELNNYFFDKKNKEGDDVSAACINEADKLLGPSYKKSGADFIEFLSRERVFLLVQKASQIKQTIIQNEHYLLMQEKREEERLTLVPPSPKQEGKAIVVNIGLQRLYAYENGKSIFTAAVPITTGKYGFETVYGEFAIYLKERMHQMRSPFPGIYYDNVVNYWMPFYLGYGLHDAPWRSIYGTQDYSAVGSHGCVNMPLNDTIILYNWAEVGTRVIVL